MAGGTVESAISDVRTSGFVNFFGTQRIGSPLAAQRGDVLSHEVSRSPREKVSVSTSDPSLGVPRRNCCCGEARGGVRRVTPRDSALISQPEWAPREEIYTLGAGRRRALAETPLADYTRSVEAFSLQFWHEGWQ